MVRFSPVQHACKPCAFMPCIVIRNVQPVIYLFVHVRKGFFLLLIVYPFFRIQKGTEQGAQGEQDRHWSESGFQVCRHAGEGCSF